MKLHAYIKIFSPPHAVLTRDTCHPTALEWHAALLSNERAISPFRDTAAGNVF